MQARQKCAQRLHEACQEELSLNLRGRAMLGARRGDGLKGVVRHLHFVLLKALGVKPTQAKTRAVEVGISLSNLCVLSQCVQCGEMGGSCRK